MLNIIWLGFFLVSFLAALGSWLFLGNYQVFSAVMEAIFKMAGVSVEIALGLIGILAFWCGLLKLAEQSGMAMGLANCLSPLFSRLMPQVPAGHPALGLVTMNMASNMLGLDNAATPIGLKAMQSLQTLNPDKAVASNPQILFLVLNTSSVTIFPVTILMYRLQQGASSPGEVFIPILLATMASTLVGLFSVILIQRIQWFDKILMAYFGGFALFILIIVMALNHIPQEQMGEVSAAVGNGLLLFLILVILCFAFAKKIPVYEGFVEGAKEGFEIAIRIIPYLVAMLCAIGALRASGVFDWLIQGVKQMVGFWGGDMAFVDALPTALMKPFSGSGARAMMLETMTTHGVDSFAAKLSAVMQGSTETTFYVLSVYFGCVGIKRIRHALGCGLIADLAGIVTAIFVSYWFFS